MIEGNPFWLNILFETTFLPCNSWLVKSGSSEYFVGQLITLGKANQCCPKENAGFLPLLDLTRRTNVVLADNHSSSPEMATIHRNGGLFMHDKANSPASKSHSLQRDLTEE